MFVRPMERAALRALECSRLTIMGSDVSGLRSVCVWA